MSHLDVCGEASTSARRFNAAKSVLLFYRPADNTISLMNPYAKKITGYDGHRFPLSGDEFFMPAGLEELLELYPRLSRAGQGLLWGQFLPFRSRDGEEKLCYATIRLAPEPGVSGPPFSLRICLYETPPVLKWDCLEYDNPDDQLALDTMRQGVWEYVFSTETFRYGHDMGQIFGPLGLREGYSMTEWMASIHPEDAPALLRNYRALFERGEPYSVRYRVRDVGGRWRWLFSTINALFLDQDGKPDLVVGRHIDVTAIMRDEKETAEAEERLRLIFEYAGIGIAVTDAQGVIHQINPAFESSSGFDRSFIVGHRISDFAYVKDRDTITQQLGRLGQGIRRELIREVRFLSSSGKMQWLTIIATRSSLDSNGDGFCILMFEDVTERKIAERKLQYEANHDDLTGAWSRGVLLERLRQHVHLAIRHRQPLSFCICDLDHFKRVNDLHGHQAGDEVLVEFGKVLQQACRNTDVIGRYGGEEFGILFPNTSLDGARHAAERARALLTERRFAGAKGVEFGVTATFGVANACSFSTPKSLISEADTALYRGKETGRNRVVAVERVNGSDCFS